uniref:Uncharacterized protein n=1 Tax=Arundo donax TaxID=35708 RepID=A0A0A9Q4C4_ARUDO
MMHKGSVRFCALYLRLFHCFHN